MECLRCGKNERRPDQKGYASELVCLPCLEAEFEKTDKESIHTKLDRIKSQTRFFGLATY